MYCRRSALNRYHARRVWSVGWKVIVKSDEIFSSWPKTLRVMFSHIKSHSKHALAKAISLSTFELPIFLAVGDAVLTQHSINQRKVSVYGATWTIAFLRQLTAPSHDRTFGQELIRV